jgi:hypothetical protein
MKWIAIGVGVVVALVVVVLVVGALLPVAHTATRSIRLGRAPADVWALVSDVAGAPAWRTDVSRVELLPPRDGRMAWREISSQGAIPYEAELWRAPAGAVPGRFVTRITDRSLPFGGGWTIDVAPDGAGTRVTITERGEVYNPLFRVVSRYVMGHAATIDGYLRALGARVGEAPAPADAPPVGGAAG